MATEQIGPILIVYNMSKNWSSRIGESRTKRISSTSMQKWIAVLSVSNSFTWSLLVDRSSLVIVFLLVFMCALDGKRRSGFQDWNPLKSYSEFCVVFHLIQIFGWEESWDTLQHLISYFDIHLSSHFEKNFELYWWRSQSGNEHWYPSSRQTI